MILSIPLNNSILGAITTRRYQTILISGTVANINIFFNDRDFTILVLIKICGLFVQRERIQKKLYSFPLSIIALLPDNLKLLQSWHNTSMLNASNKQTHFKTSRKGNLPTRRRKTTEQLYSKLISLMSTGCESRHIPKRV